MLIGKVIGRVWAAKKKEQFPSGTLLEIELERSNNKVVAMDSLSCGVGERVLVTTGSLVSKQFPQVPGLVDAIVVASLDDEAGKTVNS